MNLRPTQPDAEIRWLQCRNDSPADIPPFALLRAIGVTAKGILQVDAPDQDSQSNLFVNGPGGIRKDGFGLCTADSPMRVLYDPAGGTPNSLQDWGSKAGSFELTAFKTGYEILGGAAGGSVLAQADPVGVAGGTDPDATHTVRGYVSLADQYLGAGTKTADKLALPATVGTIANSDLVLQNRTIPSVAAAQFLTLSDRVDSAFNPYGLYFFGGSIRFRNFASPGADSVISGGGPLSFYSNFPSGAMTLSYGTVGGVDAVTRDRVQTNGTVEARAGFITAGSLGLVKGVADFNNVLQATNGLVTRITHQDFLYAQ